jgi:hypothetical protein
VSGWWFLLGLSVGSILTTAIAVRDRNKHYVHIDEEGT